MNNNERKTWGNELASNKSLPVLRASCILLFEKIKGNFHKYSRATKRKTENCARSRKKRLDENSYLTWYSYELNLQFNSSSIFHNRRYFVSKVVLLRINLSVAMFSFIVWLYFSGGPRRWYLWTTHTQTQTSSFAHTLL